MCLELKLKKQNHKIQKMMVKVKKKKMILIHEEQLYKTNISSWKNS